MSTINITINQDQLSQAMQKLASADQTIIRPALFAIGEGLTASTKRRFVTATDPEGSAWRPLQASTIKHKGNARPLIYTGILSDTIGYQVGTNELTVGTPQAYGKYHQFGTKHIPARPFLGISNDDQAMITDAVADAVDAAVKT